MVKSFTNILLIALVSLSLGVSAKQIKPKSFENLQNGTVNQSGLYFQVDPSEEDLVLSELLTGVSALYIIENDITETVGLSLFLIMTSLMV